MAVGESGKRGTVAIVGAGVVGAAIALRLNLAGWDVTVFDPNEPGSGCSMGNSGHIGISSIIPWSNRAQVKHSLRMLLDRDHPLHVSPLGWLENARWFASFIAASRPSAAQHGTKVLAGLFKTAWQDVATLVDAAGAEDLVVDRGVLQIYSSEASFSGSRGGDKIRRSFGIEIQELTTGEVHELEPALGPLAVRGTLLPGVRHIMDPQGLPQRFIAALRRRGGRVIEQPVEAILPGDGGRPRVIAGGETSSFDRVVLAGGFGSRKFFGDLGVTVPLASERGYHIQMTGHRGLISRAISFVDARVGLSPMAAGLRMTTGADFSRSTSPVRYERARHLFQRAKALLPAVGELKGREWCDARPSTPDSLPIIGHSPLVPGVILAAGHGHVGLGLSGVTARLVETLLDGGRPPEIAGTAPDRRIPAA